MFWFKKMMENTKNFSSQGRNKKKKKKRKERKKEKEIQFVNRGPLLKIS
jgi:hypothetical protein